MLPSRIKQLLKRSQLASAANARWKAARLERDRAALDRMYIERAQASRVTYSEQWVRETLARSVAVRARASGAGSPPHIFWAGANWDQDNSGFLDGLRGVASVTLATMADGGYGFVQRLPDRPPRLRDEQVVAMNHSRLLAQVAEVHRRTPIDVLLGQMWANCIGVETLQAIRAFGITTVNVSMDDRLPEHWGSAGSIRLGSVGLGPGLDLVLTSSPECCLWYAVENVPALFWPMASDPARFRPAPESEKWYDLSFVGSRYGIRARIVEGLMAAGLEVAAFGPGWPNGPIDADRTADVFARSRIILGIGTIGHNEDVFTLKLRDFDAPMAGALYLTHRNPDLLTLYEEGREIACYATLDECIAQARRYLADPDQRLRVAAAGAARARRDHTWKRRLSQALEVIGFDV